MQIYFQRFSPHVKQFNLFFLWEELPTVLGSHTEFLVDYCSAVQDLDNTEKSGIHATHSVVVKFKSAASPGYRITLEALWRYCEEAPRVIAHRWEQAIPALNKLRADEAFELGGLTFDVYHQSPFWNREIPTEKPMSYYDLLEYVRPEFIGRQGMLDAVYKALFVDIKTKACISRKSFVI